MRNVEHREQLLKMAETWNKLAEDRERFLKQQQTHVAPSKQFAPIASR
jgi:hypothetical protein